MYTPKLYDEQKEASRIQNHSIVFVKKKGGWKGDAKAPTTPYVRKAAKAGTWYKAEEKELDEELEQWIAKATKEIALTKYSSYRSQRVKAIVVPHAGYQFSGSTAACSMMALSGLKGRVKRAFVLGPSHHVALRKIAVFSSKRLATPLGALDVDTEVVKHLSRAFALASPKGFINMSERGLLPLFEKVGQAVDENEHSIEMMLPYLRKILGDSTKIVPLLVGGLSNDNLEKCVKTLEPYFLDPDNVFVISSDFCHWGHSYSYNKYDSGPSKKKCVSDYVKDLDGDALKAISEFNLAKFRKHCEETGNTICGKYPLEVLLSLCSLPKVRRNYGLSCHWTRYNQSARIDTVKPTTRDALVGYAAGVVRLHWDPVE